MTTIIFSDTHLTPKFDEKKYNYLSRIALTADRVIIAGDFWDAYQCSFEAFIDSPWQKLFVQLAKKTIYLYGNHDAKVYSDERVKLFSFLQDTVYEMTAGEKILQIEHGDRIAPAEDDNVHTFFKRKMIVSPYVYIREYLPILFFGKKALQQYEKQNIRMKNWIKKNLPKKSIFVCGHSHLAEYNPGGKFINIGFVRYGIGQYLKIKKDRINFIDEKY